MTTSVEPLLGARLRSRQPLPEEVASYVRELIMSGVLRPGDFIRMERIAEALGMSNTPVREGLVSLSSQGFVRTVPRRGFMVAHFFSAGRPGHLLGAGAIGWRTGSPGREVNLEASDRAARGDRVQTRGGRRQRS